MDNKTNYNNTTTRPFPSHLHHLHRNKRSLLALLSLLLLLLLAYNGVATFSIYIPFPAKTQPEPSGFSTENVAGESKRKWVASSTKLSSSVMYAVKQEDPPAIPKTHLPLLSKTASFSTENVAGESRSKWVASSTSLSSPVIYKVKQEDPPAIGKTHLPHSRKSHSIVPAVKNSSVNVPKRRRKRLFNILRSEALPDRFSARMKEFLGNNSSCKVRFFMTWISPSGSFGERELFVIETLFKSHPNGCLIIVSNSMDSRRGMQILKPFLANGFRVTAVSPDFDYLVKNTVAEAWFDRLKRGDVDPGEVSLGQNLSNLLRLALLYKFGGIYIDTDVIVLRSLTKLRNAIGAQTMDLATKKWSRLNNAVMVFDKGHPLLYKFIQEFALTFDGNKWGHNGPYLVSRVVSRVSGRPGYNFTVLPPVAFYPVDWSRIHSLFRGPNDKNDSKWLLSKLRHIRHQSFVVHLWNKQSKGLKIQEGSIIRRIMSDYCVFCNSSTW